MVHTETNPSPVLLLHPDDTVLICRAPVRAGDRLMIDGHEVVLTETVEIGHKLARREVQPGDPVLKYGVPIGSMTRKAAIGAHVHLHNMKSNYIASHTRQTITAEASS